MSVNYESPIIEIMSFDDCVCTFNENYEIEYNGNIHQSSSGWLPWI